MVSFPLFSLDHLDTYRIQILIGRLYILGPLWNPVWKEYNINQ